MPRIFKVRDKYGEYTVSSTFGDEIENVSPLVWFGAYIFFFHTQIEGLPKDIAKRLSLASVNEWLQKKCPDFLMDLFVVKSKKDQERLLRRQSITPDNIICWILQSGRLGGLFSQYSYDAGVPDEMKGRTPIIIDASNPEDIRTMGQTSLSKEALIYLVENQKKVIAQFIDFKDGRWFCLYRTHRGLAGRENGNQGQHVHFISSAYGIDRGRLVEGFKKGECPASGFHIKLSGYWDDGR